ncbi:MAG: DUF4410 domain-containing protein, partial [Desulfuromonadales bacterium]
MKSYLKFPLFIACMFLLSSCGSSAVVNKSINESPYGDHAKFTIDSIKSDVKDVPDHFLTAINGYLKAELDQKNLLEKTDTDTSYKINILVNEYRMRSGVSRVMFGALAGKDGVESLVTIIDPITGEVAGESTVSTFNVTAVAGMEDVAKMHA